MACEPARHSGERPVIPPSGGFMLGGQLPTVLAMLRKPAMPLIVVESGLPLRPLLPAAKKRSRRVPVSVAALALSIASSSAALLIWLGPLEAGADQAVVEAVRQSPAVTL